MKPKSALRYFLFLAGSSLLAVFSASAATLYWDGADTTANADGGAGTWNTSTGNWDDAAAAGANATWSNANPDSAVFGGIAGPVTLGAGITTSGLLFNTMGYTIDASSQALGFGAGSNTVFLNNIANASITGAVGGTGSVTVLSADPLSAGTLTLDGTSAGGWSGSTTITGARLSLSGSNQGLLNTSGVTLNGGGITLVNTSDTEGALNRVKDDGGITSNGGTITYNNTSGNTYAETIGPVTLASGQLHIVEQVHMAAGSQTLTLAGLTRSGSGSSLALAAATTSPNAGTNIIKVSGASGTAANQIIGPWLTTGTTATAQTDYGKYDASGNLIPAAIAASAQADWTTAANSYTFNAAQTLTETRTIHSLRNSGAALGVTLGTSNFDLITYGLLSGGSGQTTIANSTGGTGGLTTPTGGDNTLHLTAGNNNIGVNVEIKDNGTAVNLVKNGSGVLFMGTSAIAPAFSYTGTTTLNAGTLQLNNATALPGGFLSDSTGGNLTINEGTVTLANSSGHFTRALGSGTGQVRILGGVSGFGASTASRNVNFGGAAATVTWGSAFFNPSVFVLNQNATSSFNLTFQNALDLGGAMRTISTATGSGAAVISGQISNGGLIKEGAGSLTFSNNTSSYSGGTIINSGTIVSAASAGSGNTPLGTGPIIFAGSGTTYLSPAYNVVQTLSNSVIVNAGATASFSNGNQFQNMTITGPLSGTGTVVHQTGAGGAAGNTTFSSNSNTFTGPIRINNTGNGNGALGFSSLPDSPAATTINFGSGPNSGVLALNMPEPTVFANRQIVFSGTSSGGGTIQSNNGTAANAVTFNQDLSVTGGGNKTLELGGTNTGANTFAGLIADKPAPSGAVVSLTKSGAGTWVVSNGNNSFTGKTTISAGTLSVASIGDVNGGASALGNPSSAANGLILMGGGNNTGTLLYTGAAATSDRTIQINSSTNTNTGGATITNNGSGALTFDAPVFNAAYANSSTVTRSLILNGTNGGTISGLIQNNSATNLVSVIAEGAGVWELAGDNSYSGGTIVRSGGTLRTSGSNGSTAGTTIGTGGGTLQLNSASNGGLSSGSINLNADPGVVQAVNADRAITNSIIVQSNPAFSGSFSLNAGNLRVNNADRTVTNNIVGGKMLTLASIDRDGSNNRSLTMEGTGTTAVSGGIALGTGTLALNGGTFLINGTSTTGLVTVNGGTLGGNGTVTNSVTVGAAGNVAPGSSVGTLSIGGDLDISAMAGDVGKLNFELGPILSSDKIAVTGSLAIGTDVLGLSDFNLTSVGGLQNGTYMLISSGTLNGTLDPADVNGTLGGGTIQLQASGNDIVLVVSGLGSSSPFETWAGAGVAFDADANNDGVSNGLAWLLGAVDKDVSALGLLPEPAQSSGNLVLVFDCLPGAERGGAVLTVQYSDDLGAWAGTEVPAAVGTFTAGVVDFDVTDPAPAGGPLHVVATIPAAEAAAGKLFGRLQAVNP